MHFMKTIIKTNTQKNLYNPLATKKMNTEQAPLFKKIDKYVFSFNDMLGQGNFSKVYKAVNQQTRDVYAIKVIELNSLKSPKLQELLFSEIEVLKKLNHPNILRCYEVFTSNRNCYIVTEYCNGGDLQQKLKKEDKFSEREASSYIRDIFNGLKYLAENYVIHRDIKVANIFLHNKVAKIADFGFAKFTNVSFKDINIGSPIYMSPEALIHNIYGEKNDVWAFGVLMYELVHGRTPYSHCRNQSELRKEIKIPLQEKTLLHDLSKDLKQAILECLEIDERKRPSITELASRRYFSKNSKNIIGMISLGSKRYNSILDDTNSRSKIMFSQQKNRIITTDTPEYCRNKCVFSPRENNNRIAREMIETKYQSYNDARRKTAVSVVPEVKTRYPSIKKEQKAVFKTTHKIADRVQNKSPNFPAIKEKHKKSDPILGGVLNFRQSVNILHYCRLIYKYIMLKRQTDEGKGECQKMLGYWVHQVMNGLREKIENRQIFYEDTNGQKEKKLKQVTTEYQKKYATELQKGNKNKMVMNFKSIVSMLQTLLTENEFFMNLRKDTKYQQIGHFLLYLLESTKILSKCSEQINFKFWREYRGIEDFLGQEKAQMNERTYWEVKNQVIV